MDKVYIVGSIQGVFVSEESILDYFNEYEAFYPDFFFIKKKRLQEPDKNLVTVMELHKNEGGSSRYVAYIGVWEVVK